MTENGLGDFFIADLDDELATEQGEPVVAPVYSAPAVPAVPAEDAPQPAAPPVEPVSVPAPVAAEQPVVPAPAVPAPTEQPPAPGPAPEAAAAPAFVPPASVAPQAAAAAEPAPSGPTREQQLAAALDTFMRMSDDVEAAALVSLDGFTMASALPEGMHEDRVGAMSAAILGLGERAAIELGRGKLSQVFIEGDSGYVLLMSAGDRAVLTVLASLDAKLGLLLYDMRDVADAIAGILG